MSSDIDLLYRFAAGSAMDKSYKHLWLVGASLIIPQLNALLDHTGYALKIIQINDFKSESIDYTSLGNILQSCNSDKANHHYHIFYAYIFDKLIKTRELNILEIGIGTNNPLLVSNMGLYGRPGASLYAFREYLPHSNIYGADIDKAILFTDNRIKTCYVDQLDMKTFNDMSGVFKNITYDLIIDDGLHSIGANLNTLLFALKHINVGGWVVIEDIALVDNWKCIDFILSTNTDYKTYIIKAKFSHLYVVNKLK